MNAATISEIIDLLRTLRTHMGPRRPADREPEDQRLWDRIGAVLSTLASGVSARPYDPMDWPLPCDVKVGHITIGQGCKLRTLALRMQCLYEMKMGSPATRAVVLDAIGDALHEFGERKWESGQGLSVPPQCISDAFEAVVERVAALAAQQGAIQ